VAGRHYDEPQLATLVLNIALTNFFNRVNMTTRQVTGEWVTSAEGTARHSSRSMLLRSNIYAGRAM
jgi:hypothetical protein